MRKVNKIIPSFFQVLLTISLIGATESTFAMFPPWYLLFNQLKAMLEADTCIKVGELTGQDRNMEILINVCDYNKALALSTFISRRHEYGENAVLEVKTIYNGQLIPPSAPPSSIDQALIFLRNAFHGNKYFVKAYPNMLQDEVFAEFTPSIVQYLSDDYRDFYRNTNLVAADAFAQILNSNESGFSNILRINTTTTLIHD